MQRQIVAVAAFATALVSVSLNPALAAPQNTDVSAFQLPCEQTVCEPDIDSVLESNTLISGKVQLQAVSSSSVGLESVELQIQVDQAWTCVKKWRSSARTFSAHLDWDTNGPLEGCGGEILDGSNGIYRFRTYAIDRTSTGQSSKAFLMRVVNRPEPPAWAGEPIPNTKTRPTIELRWRTNLEPDIVEYHFTRTGPGGAIEFAVSAARPGGQGCQLVDNVYHCTDDAFGSSYNGTYTYALVAFRASSEDGTRCALPGSGNCVASAISDSRTVSLRSATASPSAEPSAAPPPPPPAPPEAPRPPQVRLNRNGRGGAAGADFCFTCGEYELALPYEAAPPRVEIIEPATTQEPETEESLYALDPELAASMAQEQTRRGIVGIAAGLMLLALATHLGRTLRRQS